MVISVGVGMKYIVLAMTVLLFGCNTTPPKPVDISNVNLNNPYVIGYYVNYSEICATFRGTGADKLVLRALIKKYENNSYFQKGYERNSSLYGYDLVTNLPLCDKAYTIVNAAYDRM